MKVYDVSEIRNVGLIGHGAGKRRGAPPDIATCMYYTEMDPADGAPVYVPRSGRERRWQRALLQFFKPENYADVRRALEQAGRTDLIGRGPGCLIPPHPPKTSAKRGKKRARSGARGVSQLAVNGVSPVTGSSTGKMPLPPGRGYRPHRTSAKRRPRG